MIRSRLVSFLGKVPANSRPLLLTGIYGLTGGLSAVIFEVGINLLYGATFVRMAAHHSAGGFVAGTLAVIVVTSLAAGFLLSRFCPEAAGSGIPQLKLAFWRDFGYVPLKVVWVKFVAGILTVGGGASLGREGPTVQLAGGASSYLAGKLGVAKNGRRLPAVAGAAAGLAAAFNAPLASITFVLEEIVEDLNSRMLGGILLAAVLGALTVQGLLGNRPAFDLPPIGTPSWRGYMLVPLSALLASLVGVAFQAGTLGLRMSFRRVGAMKAVPPMLRPLLGGLVTWAIGVAIFLWSGHLGIFSLGYDDLTLGLNDRLTWELAAVLLGGKFVSTVVGYGTGGCGGIFAPNLFLGAMCGVSLSGLARATGWHLTTNDHVLLSVIAMSACLGAVVRAPLTSILIVFEMTHEFSLVPALLAGALISQAVSRALIKHNFYEQVLVEDGHHLHTVMPPRDLRGWRQYPVSAIASFQPVVLVSGAAGGPAPESVRKVLEEHPNYERFPVVRRAEDGAVAGYGLVLRDEAKRAVEAGRAPVLYEAPPTLLREQSIGEAQHLLIESAQGLVVLLDKPDGVVVGLVTLHDLLRAQENFAQQAESSV